MALLACRLHAFHAGNSPPHHPRSPLLRDDSGTLPRLTSSLRHPAGFVVALALVLGAAPRLAAWLAARSLWLDEAMLALNVAGRSFGELLGPLEYGQTGSPIFLWLSRLAAVTAGSTELALRALPLATGLLLLWLVWQLGRALLGPEGGALGALLVALSPPLVRYAAEFKPYGPDAAVTVGVALVALRVVDRPADSRPWAALVAAGIAAALASLSAPMLLAGVVAALALAPAVRAQPRWAARVALLAAVWAGVFAAVYFTVYSGAANDTFLRRQWAATFLDPWAPDFRARLRSALEAILAAPLPGSPHLTRLSRLLPCVLVACAGVWWAVRRRGWSGAALLVGPVAATLAAGMLGRYGLAERLVVFLHPLVLLTYAGGMALVVGWLPRAARGPALLAAAAAAVRVGAPSAIEGALAPSGREELRPLVVEARRRPPQETLYILGRSLPAYWFYTSEWGGRAAGTRAQSPRSVGPGELSSHSTGMTWTQAGGWSAPSPPTTWGAAEAERLAAAAQPYVWILAGHTEPGALDVLLASAHHIGARTVWSHYTDGAALLRLRFPAEKSPQDPGRGGRVAPAVSARDGCPAPAGTRAAALSRRSPRGER
jgi:hypothetical protein